MDWIGCGSEYTWSAWIGLGQSASGLGWMGFSKMDPCSTLSHTITFHGAERRALVTAINWLNLGNGGNNPQKGHAVRNAIISAFCELWLVILYVLTLSRYCQFNELMKCCGPLTKMHNLWAPITQMPPNQISPNMDVREAWIPLLYHLF